MIKHKLQTLIFHPKRVVKKYNDKIYYSLFKIAKPLLNEDYGKHWNFTTFKGKTVLDLGADYGSTAWYFKRKGAARVIAVEGDHQRAELLKKNSEKYEFFSYELMVKSAEDIEWLLKRHRNIDVAKVDIEGAEIFLSKCDPQLIKNIPFWMIETHSEDVNKILLEWFSDLGYNVSRYSVRTLKDEEIEKKCSLLTACYVTKHK